MPHLVLVLTCSPKPLDATPPLDEALVQSVQKIIQAQYPQTSHLQARWLKPGVAWELDQIPDQPAEVQHTLAAIREALKARPVDVNIVPSGLLRRKSLLIADMDSTIIQQECIDEIAHVAGVGPRVAEITERAMLGEMDFEQALNERVSLLKGLDADVLGHIFEDRITITPGARTLVATMSENAALCALVSGGFTFFTSRVAEITGFHQNRANTLEIRNGKLTGQVVPPILGRAAKQKTLNTLTEQRGLTLEQSLAVGDGANDLAMIKDAGLGVAFRAKPIVANDADADIMFGDLTALLYLQGYSESEFARP